MRKYIISVYPGFFLLLLSLTGCRKFVDPGNPQSNLVTNSVFSNDATAIDAMLAVYVAMRLNTVPDLVFQSGLSADELTSYSGADNSYRNALTSMDGAALCWAFTYKNIYLANAVLEGLNDNHGVTRPVRDQLNGEAKFLRAFLHFVLLQYYGSIPIVTTTDYAVIRKLARSAPADVYQQILTDLLDARDLLGDDYVDSKNAGTIERVRPNKWVVTAFLARVYLFMGDYAHAGEASSALINNAGKYQLLTDLNTVFLKNSREAIWQLMPDPKWGYNTYEGHKFIPTGMPDPGSGAVSLSPQILQAFETGDLRKSNWMNSLTSGASTWYYPFKYKIQNGSDLQEYSMVLRLAEQYLIRAEARIQQGHLSDGIADLNAIRNRAGLPATTATVKEDLLTAILHERQVELFTEGHRWFDLKRTGTVDAVMEVVTPLKGGIWKSYQQYFPIDVNDLQSSINLKQTPGY